MGTSRSSCDVLALWRNFEKQLLNFCKFSCVIFESCDNAASEQCEDWAVAAASRHLQVTIQYWACNSWVICSFKLVGEQCEWVVDCLQWKRELEKWTEHVPRGPEWIRVNKSEENEIIMIREQLFQVLIFQCFKRFRLIIKMRRNFWCEPCIRYQISPTFNH